MNIGNNLGKALSLAMIGLALSVPAYADEQIERAVQEESSNMTVTVEEGLIGFKGVNSKPKDKGKEYFPFEISHERDEKAPVIIKSYLVSADCNPERLVEEDFRENGFEYSKVDILVEKPRAKREEKLISVPVKFATDDNKKETLKGTLEPVIDYCEDGFKGQLKLDYDSIVSVADKENSFSYPIMKTIEYNNLDSKDYAYIKKQADGLKLKDVDWELQNGSELYTAYANYEGVGYGKRVAEYKNTAFYIGTVAKEIEGEKVCSVVYKGKRIFPWGDIATVTVGLAFVGGILVTTRKLNKLKTEENENE